MESGVHCSDQGTAVPLGVSLLSTEEKGNQVMDSLQKPASHENAVPYEEEATAEQLGKSFADAAECKRDLLMGVSHDFASEASAVCGS